MVCIIVSILTFSINTLAHHLAGTKTPNIPEIAKYTEVYATQTLTIDNHDYVVVAYKNTLAICPKTVDKVAASPAN